MKKDCEYYLLLEGKENLINIIRNDIKALIITSEDCDSDEFFSRIDFDCEELEELSREYFKSILKITERKITEMENCEKWWKIKKHRNC